MNYLIEFPELSKDSLRLFKKFIDETFRNFSRSYGDSIELFFKPLSFFMTCLENALVLTPWPIMLVLLAAATYYFTKSLKLAFAVIAYFVAIGLLGLWVDTMYSVSLVLASTAISIVIGVPVGVLMAKSNLATTIINPILDVMQTIPIFVYLIPVVMLLGLGKVPGVIAMCIYSVPPVIRLTNLGIREVQFGMIEAAYSLGMTRFQTLHRVELPIAKKSILMGINQTIMMSISMVVIASMIGVQGLGTTILQAVQNQYIGAGLIGGFAIVGLAIIIDRIVQHAK